MHSYLRVPLALLCLGQMSAALAVCWTPAKEVSVLEFIGSAVNSPGSRPFEVHGNFTAYEGTLCLSDAVYPDSSFHLSVDLTSVTMRDHEYTSLVKGGDMLDVAHFPTATFDATSIEYHGPAADSDVKGKLTLHGVTREVAFPVTIQPNPRIIPADLKYAENENITLVEGSLAVNRLDYGIGSNYWAKTDTLADSITIHFQMYMRSMRKNAVPAPSAKTGGR